MKRAVVTGCSRGIGRAVAEMLMDEGWFVIGMSRTKPVGFTRGPFVWYETDVRRPRMIEAIRVSIDALIHCAAVRGPHDRLEDAGAVAWRETIETNLMGTYAVVRKMLPGLRVAPEGRILLFSGGGAFDPSPGYSAYAVAKAGVVSLMETLAVEMRTSAITVNCVAPGFVATDIHRGTPDEGRLDGGAMANVVDCVRHLLSPQTRGLTGKTISAQHDDWASLSALTIEAVNASPMGTRTRHKLQLVANLAAYRTKKVI